MGSDRIHARSVGAVASVADASCLASQKGVTLADASSAAYYIWQNANLATKSRALLSEFNLPALGQHYFVSAGTGINPKWDFVAAMGPNAYVVGSKVAGLPAPTGSNDVDWLQLKGVDGGLGNAVYRVHTRGGVAPASCTPGTDVNVMSVKYSAIYCEFFFIPPDERETDPWWYRVLWRHFLIQVPLI